MNLEKAIEIAVIAHKGQKRIKAEKGLPYIIHPLRVMLDTRFITTEEEKIVAVLHDVIEDTNWTYTDLREWGFSEIIIEAIDSVTKRDGETYEQKIERASKNSIGRMVKLADLHDNNKPPTKKYSDAIQYLLAVELA